MDTAKLGLLAFLLWPSLALAGKIDGTVFEGGRPVSGSPIELDCGTGEALRTTTDASGAFSLFVPVEAVCSLKLPQQGLAHRVSSYAEPVRYNLELVRQQDGSALLRRQ